MRISCIPHSLIVFSLLWQIGACPEGCGHHHGVEALFEEAEDHDCFTLTSEQKLKNELDFPYSSKQSDMAAYVVQYSSIELAICLLQIRQTGEFQDSHCSNSSRREHFYAEQFHPFACLKSGHFLRINAATIDESWNLAQRSMIGLAFQTPEDHSAMKNSRAQSVLQIWLV